MPRAAAMPDPLRLPAAAAPAPVVVIHAHPHPDRSLAGAALLAAVRDLPGVAVSSLYDRYPDFAIDVAAEQRLLADARLIVWLHPLQWYTVPALLKLWFEAVLAHGWAYGDGARALAGKDCLWAVTTGAAAASYAAEGPHGAPFAAFEPVVRHTARFCGLCWLEPIVLHEAHRGPPAARAAAAAALRARVQPYLPSAAPGAQPA